MKLDRELRDRLGRAADGFVFDPESALDRLHGARRRRVAARRLVTVFTALVVAIVGLSVAWWALPIERNGAATSTGPSGPEAVAGPDGTLAYMVVTDGGEASSISTTDVATPEPVALDTDAFAIYPVWSPDGSRIAYAAGPDYDHLELTVANADGSDARGLGVEIRGTFAWSPDGTQLAYVGVEGETADNAVSVIGADGSGDRLVLRGLEWQGLSWSPDGQRLVVAGHPGGQGDTFGPEGWDLYSVRTDGSQLVQLTRTQEYEHFAAWSPDGSSILFSRSTEYDDASYESDLYLIDADGSNERRLTDWEGFDSFPVWSSDGRWIAFASDREATAEQQRVNREDSAFANFSIYAMRPDGSGIERLLTAVDGETLLPGSWKV